MRTPAVEDYLRAIYSLRERDEAATTSAIAEALGIRPASVTNMLKRLDALGLVHYVPYQGVALRLAGERIALEMVRHHRLLELYLVEALGIPWDQVHEEADRLEHVISEELEARIAAVLGEPDVDPHGDPIPTPELQARKMGGVPLSQCPPGQEVTIARVTMQAPEVLRYLARLGLQPGVRVTCLESPPAGEHIHVRVGESEHRIELELADRILVAPSGDRSP